MPELEVKVADIELTDVLQILQQSHSYTAELVSCQNSPPP